MKEAYHRILMPDGQLVFGPVVVETDENQCLLGWHVMRVEESFTLWRGGTYRMSELKK